MHNDVKAKLIQVIEVEHIRGGAADHEPQRPVKTYWDRGRPRPPHLGAGAASQASRRSMSASVL